MTDDTSNPDRHVLTVWSDIGCPWASLALHTLHAAAEHNHQPLVIDHRAFPLELFNRRATPKPIIEAEIVAIAGLCPQLNWRQWSAPDGTYPVTMLPAMAAVQAAKDEQIGGWAASDELDTRLRHAFYSEGRCISMHSEILDIAAACTSVDEKALATALEQGRGVADVYAQWRIAKKAPVTGSPHLFSNTVGLHNPGVEYRWTAPPDDGGVPRFTSYTTKWADAVLATTSGDA